MSTPVRVKRKSKVYNACTMCRQRKTKCNGAWPCSLCIKNGEDCVFLSQRTRGRKKKTAAAMAATDKQQTTKLLNALHAVQSGMSFMSFQLPTLSAEEIRFVDLFFRHIGPTTAFVTRDMVDALIAKAKRGGAPADPADAPSKGLVLSKVPQDAAEYMLMYAVLAIGAHLSGLPDRARRMIHIAARGMSLCLEKARPVTLYAVILVSLYWLGIKAKLQMYSTMTTAVHLGRVLKDKRIDHDPRVDSPLCFFETVICRKLEWRQDAAEDFLVPPLPLIPDPATGVPPVNSRIARMELLLTHAVVALIQTRWQQVLDDATAAYAIEVLAQVDKLVTEHSTNNKLYTFEALGAHDI